jgi:predicted nucleic acid-binding protein
MTSIVPLDASVIGLLCSHPTLPQVAGCLAWVARLKNAGTIVVLPDITLYEVRRELIRVGAHVKLARLSRLGISLKSAPVTPDAWLKAADFWAIVRATGKPTADPNALDGDAILAGVAATIGAPGDQVIIATSNVGHMARFPGIDARPWQKIP